MLFRSGQLREKIGFTEDEAAGRLGITVERFRYLLDGVDWRQSEKIPLVTVQAVRKRMDSRHGYTIEEVAGELGKTVQWVNEQIDAGVIRVSRAQWDLRRRYVSALMLARLRKAAESGPARPAGGRPGGRHTRSSWTPRRRRSGPAST